MNNIKLKCSFVTGSTNEVTQKAELPGPCKRKGCAGVFIGKLPMCEQFLDGKLLLALHSNEKIAAAKVWLELAREGVDISVAIHSLIQEIELPKNDETVAICAAALFRHHHNLGNDTSKNELTRNRNPDVRKGIRDELKDILRN